MRGRRSFLFSAALLAALTACGGAAPVAVKPVRLERHSETASAAGTLSNRVAIGRVPIFMYHHVGPTATKWKSLYVSLPQFSRQMAALARADVTTLTMEDLFQAARRGRTFESGAVALTFDDGTEDQYQLVYPILRRHKLRATFFVSPGLLGKPGYMSWSQVKEMARSGDMLFAAHTLTHADLVQLGSEEASKQISESRRVLEEMLGTKIRHFAYPYGHVNAEVEALVKAAGFVTGVTTKFAERHDVATPLRWGRMTIHTTNLPENLVALCRESKGWTA